MAGILDLLIVMGGLLLILGIGGAVSDLVCRIPIVKRALACFYKTLPMGRREVQELSRNRYSCRD